MFRSSLQTVREIEKGDQDWVGLVAIGNLIIMYLPLRTRYFRTIEMRSQFSIWEPNPQISNVSKRSPNSTKKDFILLVFYKLQPHETFFDQFKDRTLATKDEVKINAKSVNQEQFLEILRKAAESPLDHEALETLRVRSGTKLSHAAPAK
jgi:hypothetical protein